MQEIPQFFIALSFPNNAAICFSLWEVQVNFIYHICAHICDQIGCLWLHIGCRQPTPDSTNAAHACPTCPYYSTPPSAPTCSKQDFTELNTDGIITPIWEIKFDLWILKWPLPKRPLWIPSNFLVAWCVLPVLRIQCLHFWSCLLAKTSLLHLNFASSVYTPI